MVNFYAKEPCYQFDVMLCIPHGQRVRNSISCFLTPALKMEAARYFVNLVSFYRNSLRQTSADTALLAVGLSGQLLPATLGSGPRIPNTLHIILPLQYVTQRPEHTGGNLWHRVKESVSSSPRDIIWRRPCIPLIRVKCIELSV
jgi:hypothetical protein